MQFDSEIFDQNFTLLMDPKTEVNGVNQEDISDQISLALDVVDLLSDMRREEDRIESRLKELSREEKLSADQKSEKEKLLSRKAQLVTAEGTYMQPMMLSQAGYLYRLVIGTDKAPGQEEKEHFEELMAKWDEFMAD